MRPCRATMNFFIFSHSERNADDGAPLLIARSLSVHTQREGGRLTTSRVFGLAGRTALYSGTKTYAPEQLLLYNGIGGGRHDDYLAH